MRMKQLILYAATGAVGMAAGAAAVLYFADYWPQASLEFNAGTRHTAPFRPVREEWGKLPYATLQLFEAEPSPLTRAEARHKKSSERVAALMVESLDARPDGSAPFAPLLPPHFLDILPYSGPQCPADARLEELLNRPLKFTIEQRLLVKRSLQYHATVKSMAKQYNVDPALVLAIMQVESRFSPQEQSHRNAIGLMQIVPETAGREIWRWLKKDGKPSVAELLQPEQNIRYGTLYLHLLLEHHFSGIMHPLSREYCVIASYNGGSGVVLRLFSESREGAFALINTMAPEDVYDFLLSHLASGETRAFLQQVLDARRVHQLVLQRRNKD